MATLGLKGATMFDFLCLFMEFYKDFMSEYVNNAITLNKKRNSTQHKTMEHLTV